MYNALKRSLIGESMQFSGAAVNLEIVSSCRQVGDGAGFSWTF